MKQNETSNSREPVIKPTRDELRPVSSQSSDNKSKQHIPMSVRSIMSWLMVTLISTVSLFPAATAAAQTFNPLDPRWGMHRMGISREISSTTSVSKLPPTDTETGRILTTKVTELQRELQAKEQRDALYADHMKRLPRLRVGLRKTADIECNLDKSLENSDYNLTWVKFNRSSEQSDAYPDSQLVISLDNKVISPNRRYKVIKENSTVWHLRINDIKEEDGEAMYLCQVHQTRSAIDHRSSQHAAVPMLLYGFSRGALLHVLVPPIVIEGETSPMVVLANEYEPVSLRCKFWSPQRNYITWRREDGKPLHDLPEWMHVAARSPNNRNWDGISDSSTLRFDKFLREHAGVYSCSAVNGVGGVQQRIELIALNCRQMEDKASPDEDCKAPRSNQTMSGESRDVIPTPPKTNASLERAIKRAKNVWKTSGKLKQTTDKRPATNVLNAVEEKHHWPDQEHDGTERVEFVQVADSGARSALISRPASSCVLLAQTVGLPALLMLLL